jgi:hypothetical protein
MRGECGTSCYLEGYALTFCQTGRRDDELARCLHLVATLSSLSPAVAGEPSSILHRVSCTVVRYYVALYSATAAEQYARSKGATDTEIERARRCIKSQSTLAASAQQPAF